MVFLWFSHGYVKAHPGDPAVHAFCGRNVEAPLGSPAGDALAGQGDAWGPIACTRPGKHTKSYEKWPFIVDLPIKHGDFP